MSDELPPLSSRLSELLQKEREASPAIPSGSADRVLGMLRSLGPVVPPAAGSGADAPQAPAHKPPATWPVSKSLIVAGATGVLGFVGGIVATPAKEAPAPKPPEVTVPAPAEPAPSMVEVDAGHAQEEPAKEPEAPKTRRKPVTPVEAPKVEPPAPAPVQQPAPTTQGFDVQHASERQLIDAARVALGKGRSHDALVFLMGHERRFPEGTFIEERELLIIEAMVAEGRAAQAQQRGKAFLARFPHSTHAPRVRSLIGAP